MSSLKNNLEKNRIEKGTLYLVATPIGNLSDISERALKVLAEVDFIAAEDTRNTAKLLSAFSISKPMISYHEHNKRERSSYIIDRLQNGESCAVVSDAGTPAISDPGADIALECIRASIPVTSVPGACAAITALTLSGMDTRRFVFEGFLPSGKSDRRKRLDDILSEKRTIIIYEAPHRLKSTLNDLKDSLGNRSVALCRELTKLNEEIYRADFDSAIKKYADTDPRGEYVIVINGKNQFDEDEFWKDMSVAEHIDFYIDKALSKMDAIKAVAKDRGVTKNEIYKQTIK